MKEGDIVKVRAAGEFNGWTGQIVRIEQSRGGRPFVWVHFPDHPWQQKNDQPFSFRREELEEGKKHGHPHARHAAPASTRGCG